jgi:rhomboid protease GluP
MKQPELVEVARFRHKLHANQRALVIAAMGLPYWLMRDEDRYLLCVEARHAEAVIRELAEFERERSLRPRRERDYSPAARVPLNSLIVAAAMLAGFFVAQQVGGYSWKAAGIASSEAILHGEWWRTITALTLHADASHIGANIAAGCLFAAFLVPQLGAGVTWLGVAISGMIGNWLNALGHRGETHLSIGASTAVFGALGMLSACQLFARYAALRRVRLWEFIVPIGAGVSLLAFFGVGDEQVDYAAHLCGFAAGLPLGFALAWVQAVRPAGPEMQRVMGLTAMALPVVGWAVAMRG